MKSLLVLFPPCVAYKWAYSDGFQVKPASESSPKRETIDRLVTERMIREAFVVNNALFDPNSVRFPTQDPLR